MGKPYRSLLITGLLSTTLVLAGCSEKEAVYQPAVAKLIESADAMAKNNQVDEAICRLKAAADIAPETYQVHYNLGVLYSNASHWSAAVQELEKAVKLQPDQPNGLYTLGLAYQALGDAYYFAGQVTDPKELEASDVPPEIRGMPPAEAQAKAVETYQNAVKTYEAFLKKAPSNDPGRKEVQSQLDALQQKLGSAPQE